MVSDREKNLTSVLITLLIIAMLILSQPSTALMLSVQPDKSTYNTGETVTLTATIKIESNELLPIQDVRLVLVKDGSEYENVSLPIQETTTDVQGANINFNVSVSWADVGYGYGYGYASYNGSGYYMGYGYGYGYGYAGQYTGSGTATISYTIKFTVSAAGSYDAKLVVKANGNEFVQSSSFTVSSPPAPTPTPTQQPTSGGGWFIPLPPPTPEETPTPTPTPTPEATPTPEVTPTSTPSPTPTPVSTPVKTVTPAPTPTKTVTPTPTPEVTPTKKPWWRIPGFEAVFALIAIATVGVMLRRGRR
ncbi:PGF-CTERM sorting domain-containing protein [Geoglobus acetivorans]|uniref:PGF-CTERM archaeal protein-sorting signal domain-containing protein n=1 Tax=Geoglobus acetivorans TaxID=565033 RepID=A0A0A7GCI9_GEOAI|nr:hypothetical protein GACE_0515 [Geoglobus acetivorans]